MKRTRKFLRKRFCMLTAAVLAGLSVSLSVAAAEDIPVKYVYHDGEKFAAAVFFPENVGLVGKRSGNDYYFVRKSTYTLSDDLQNDALSGISYWADILGDGAKNKQPWEIYINTDDRPNASAGSRSVSSTGDNWSFLREESFVKDQIQEGHEYSVLDQAYMDDNDGVPAEGNYGFSVVTIGRNFGANRDEAIDGWWTDTDTVLPTNEQAADYVGTIRHELGHALGILLIKGSLKYDGNSYQTIYSKLKSPDSWSLHLMDQTGKMAKPDPKMGMIIVTNDDPNMDLKKLNEDRAVDGYSALTEKDVFIVDKEVKENGNGFAYFVGEHVTDALGGAKFFGRSALPVNGWEASRFEGSHLQTTGMMSHRSYSNYTSFMEVELAVMQDLGYDIDRKAYFGKSIYGDDGTINNTQGYFARNEDGTAYLENTYSTVPLGIGLHIYGSNNTVTQSANILTRGAGATGVRVDGMKNTLNIPADTEIHADGYRGNGILIAYGSGQTVNQAGTVTASGQGGTGIRFDFGSSTNGAKDEYRGSYIRYKRYVNNAGSGSPGTIVSGENLSLTAMGVETYNAAPNELNGAMVENYNLSGILVGGENAIYIAKNAFVKNINVNEGASIKGNITSDWKQFGDAACEGSYDVGNKPLRIQYGENKRGEKGYVYYAYIPDLVTNLNFNANMTYNGNIFGEDNMKLNVNGGTLNYGGKANVVSVNVAKGAKLFGGNYIVSQKIVEDGFTDNTTGTFINHGTIAPTSDRDMDITGNLVSDGGFGISTFDSGKQSTLIDVSGTANIGGTKLVNIEEQAYLPGQEYTFLKANTIEGTLGTRAGDAFSGFLDVDAINNTKVSLRRSENIGSMDTDQKAIYDSVDAIYNSTDAAGKGRVGKLYSLGVEKGKEALTDMSTGAATDAAPVMRQNSVMTALTARHRYLTHQANVPVTIPMGSLVKNFAPTSPKPSTSTVDPGLDIIVPVELSEGGGLWFKFAKGWGSYGKGDVTGNGFTTTVGADFPVSPQWKLGALFSYSNESYGGKRDHRDTKDSRFGVYGDWRLGPQSAFLYLGGGWQKHDQKRHFYAGDHYLANADYSSNTIEFDGRYTYDLSYGKPGWHHKPFASFQVVHYRQGSYSESGAYEFGQAVDSGSSTYTAATVGWGFARDFGKDGYLEFELGLMQTLGGENSSYTARLVGGGDKFTIRSASMDKTRILAGFYGSQAINDRWRIGGEIGLAQGAHDQDVTASLSLRYSW